MISKNDYNELLDREIISFIDETGSWFPNDGGELSVLEQRSHYDRMCEAFKAPRPENVETVDSFIPSDGHAIPIRTYTSNSSNRATVIYFHGGGFVVGGLESHDDVCAEICDLTGFDVVSVDYRLSPENCFPDDLEDAICAFEHIRNNSEAPIVLVGDSAGGCLAAAVSHANRNPTSRINGQVLIYPGLGGDIKSGSYVEHANAPMLSTDDVAFYHRMRCKGELELIDDPRYSPLRDNDFADLPPTFVIAAQYDPLAQDGMDYCSKINEAGGTAQIIIEPGLVHGFLRARHRCERAAESYDRIIGAVKQFGEARSLTTP